MTTSSDAADEQTPRRRRTVIRRRDGANAKPPLGWWRAIGVSVLLIVFYFIAPLGIFSLLIVLTGSMFNPQLVRAAGYTLIITVVLFGVISMASQIMSAMQAV